MTRMTESKGGGYLRTCCDIRQREEKKSDHFLYELHDKHEPITDKDVKDTFTCPSGGSGKDLVSVGATG